MPSGAAHRIVCPNCGSEILTFSDDVTEEYLLERHRTSGRCPGAEVDLPVDAPARLKAGQSPS